MAPLPRIINSRLKWCELQIYDILNTYISYHKTKAKIPEGLWPQAFGSINKLKRWVLVLQNVTFNNVILMQILRISSNDATRSAFYELTRTHYTVSIGQAKMTYKSQRVLQQVWQSGTYFGCGTHFIASQRHGVVDNVEAGDLAHLNPIKIDSYVSRQFGNMKDVVPVSCRMLCISKCQLLVSSQKAFHRMCRNTWNADSLQFSWFVSSSWHHNGYHTCPQSPPSLYAWPFLLPAKGEFITGLVMLQDDVNSQIENETSVRQGVYNLDVT